MPAGKGNVLIGMSERTSRQAISQLAATLFAKGAAERVIVAAMPKIRSAMHLDTVFTFADRDCVLLAPDFWRQAVSDGDEATAIRAATAGLRQTFDVEALPAMTTPAIHGVQVTLLARKTDAGTGRVRALVASGAQMAVSSDINLQEQLAWHTALFERNPNGNVQWTEAAFNAAEFGLESA